MFYLRYGRYSHSRHRIRYEMVETGAGVSGRAAQRHRKDSPGNLRGVWGYGNMEPPVGGSVMCSWRQKVVAGGRGEGVVLGSGS